MLRIVEDTVYAGVFGRYTAIHHQHRITHLGHHA
jgi:hypothetical protein